MATWFNHTQSAAPAEVARDEAIHHHGTTAAAWNAAAEMFDANPDLARAARDEACFHGEAQLAAIDAQIAATKQ